MGFIVAELVWENPKDIFHFYRIFSAILVISNDLKVY